MLAYLELGRGASQRNYHRAAEQHRKGDRVRAQTRESRAPSTSRRRSVRDLVLELAVGLALMGLGFGIPWLFVGERALDYTGMTAWGKGDAVTVAPRKPSVVPPATSP